MLFLFELFQLLSIYSTHNVSNRIRKIAQKSSILFSCFSLEINIESSIQHRQWRKVCHFLWQNDTKWINTWGSRLISVVTCILNDYPYSLIKDCEKKRKLRLAAVSSCTGWQIYLKFFFPFCFFCAELCQKKVHENRWGDEQKNRKFISVLIEIFLSFFLPLSVLYCWVNIQWRMPGGSSLYGNFNKFIYKLSVVNNFFLCWSFLV